MTLYIIILYYTIFFIKGVITFGQRNKALPLSTQNKYTENLVLPTLKGEENTFLMTGNVQSANHELTDDLMVFKKQLLDAFKKTVTL